MGNTIVIRSPPPYNKLKVDNLINTNTVINTPLAGGNINLAYQFCINACNDPNTRYDQTNRLKRIDGLMYYDCSSLMWASLRAGGFDVGEVFLTKENETSELERMGFVNIYSTDSVLPGDIGWRMGHTEMCYTGGTRETAIWMGARSANKPKADQVAIGGTKSWTRIYRYGSGGTGGGASYQPSYNPYAIAAICGCMQMESTMNPNLWEMRHGTRIGDFNQRMRGYGLLQSTNTGSDADELRLASYKAFADANGKPVYDGDTQCTYYKDFDPGRWLNFGGWKASIGVSSMDDFLSYNWTDFDRPVECFMDCNIRITGNRADRKRHAQLAYDYVITQGHLNDPNITGWAVNPSFNGYYGRESQEAKNNYVMVFRHFSTGGFAGIGDGTLKRKTWLYNLRNPRLYIR